MNCPKCGYQRKAKETAPAGQCPGCGVYYAKVDALQQAAAFAPKPVIYADTGRSTPVFKIASLVALAAAAVYFAQGYLQSPPGGADRGSARRGELLAPDGRTLVRDLDLRGASITMYSLTTCVYCRDLRRIFEANNVPYREHFIDNDIPRQHELFAKLERAGFRGGAVGTPTLDVNGTMLLNNPPLAEILKAATGGVYQRRG